ncbi:MAG: cytochrome c [Candidatus Competibacteraceae bacterium]|nr:cytochrome c [Candidatus Competibacteraceae bacterium]
MMKLVKQAVIATLLAGGLTVSAVAEVKPDDAIQYRQSVFQLYKWNIAPLGGMVKGEVPYDAELVKRNAERLEFLATLPLEGFGPGTDKGDKMKTDAKPEIWQDFDQFKSLMENMGTEAGKLAETAASGDEGAVKAQIGALAKSCKTCHDDFREKN